MATPRTGLAIVAVLGVLAAGASALAPRPDEWSALVATGDRLAVTGGTQPTATGDLSPRGAYLLAFHHAHDALDVDRMLVVAERIVGLGDTDLARHLRQVAREVEMEMETTMRRP